MLAAFLALTASLMWGSANLLGGLESRRRSVWTVVAVSQAVAVLSAGGVLLVAQQSSPDLQHAFWPVLGGAADAIGIVALYRALALGSMSAISPIIAAQSVVPVIVGLGLGERTTDAAYFGMVCVIVGVMLVAWSKHHGDRRTTMPAILLATLATVCFGTKLVGLDMGGSESPYWTVFLASVACACVTCVFFLAGKQSLDLGTFTIPTLACIGLCLTIGSTVFTMASMRGHLSVVSILGSFSPIVTVLYGFILLHERLAARQYVGIATVFVGVTLLSL